MVVARLWLSLTGLDRVRSISQIGSASKTPLVDFLSTCTNADFNQRDILRNTKRKAMYGMALKGPLNMIGPDIHLTPDEDDERRLGD